MKDYFFGGLDGGGFGTKGLVDACSEPPLIWRGVMHVSLRVVVVLDVDFLEAAI
jgi:hypothetical protein